MIAGSPVWAASAFDDGVEKSSTGSAAVRISFVHPCLPWAKSKGVVLGLAITLRPIMLRPITLRPHSSARGFLCSMS